ncbi:hypothetical protein VM1G_11457 [Cytospora mali]|uniref:F-box domain-containing protein n=1 Tax=Cytospora mali TaxID=578113 RepID=A0A194VTD4_CYTMA|nr:hypothetical protein VM1G_11457 [Valsa mali]
MFLRCFQPTSFTTMDYRVSKELILDIAEHCDRKTLLSLLQTNKEIHALISDHEHSISAAKLKNFLIPPQSHLMTSKDEKRMMILNKNSFATVQELEMRERRMNSILNHGGFLLTNSTKSLGLTTDSLDKLKAGLKRAMYIVDCLADVTVDPEILNLMVKMAHRVAALRLDSLGTESDEDIAALRDAESETQVEVTRAIRIKQSKIITGLSTLDLALLLTLGEGAMVGWQRYMAKYASSDVRFYNKMDAFGELILRWGSFFLWGFVRGTGTLLSYINDSITVVAEHIWRYEMGFDQSDNGLSMAVYKELKERVREAKHRDDDSFDDAELDSPVVVKQWAHELVGKEIGCEEWKGYYAVPQEPVRQVTN